MEGDRCDQDHFAESVLNALRKDGENREIEYDSGQFALLIKETDGSVCSILHLTNRYQDYLTLPPERQMDLVLEIARDHLEMRAFHFPDSFQEAAPHLLPCVDERTRYESYHLSLQIDNLGLDRGELNNLEFNKRKIPYLPMADCLGVSLVYDLPNCKVQITQQCLTEWKVELAEALAAAEENLQKITPSSFKPLFDGFYASEWSDTYDASRICLPSLMKGLRVQGEPVVMIVNRDVVFVTGSQDREGLEKLAYLTNKGLKELARPARTMPIVLSGTEWAPLELRPEEVSFDAFRWWHNLKAMVEQDSYEEQSMLLSRWFEKTGEKTNLPKVEVVEDQESRLMFSLFTWAKTGPSLVPKTSLVALPHQHLDIPDKNIFIYPFEKIQQAAGDELAPTPLYPPRYRVQEMPRFRGLKESLGDDLN